MTRPSPTIIDIKDDPHTPTVLSWNQRLILELITRISQFFADNHLDLYDGSWRFDTRVEKRPGQSRHMVVARRGEQRLLFTMRAPGGPGLDAEIEIPAPLSPSVAVA